jgi:hypothetical protein
VLIWGLVTASWAVCGDRTALLADLETKTLEGRFEDADEAANALVEAFACGGPPTGNQLARMWLAEAALLLATGETVAADDALHSAASLSPSTWNDLYGPVMRQRWEEAGRRVPEAPGTLLVEGVPAGWVVSVDGLRVHTWPAALPAGLHLLQVGPDEQSARAALRFAIPPGQDLVLTPEIPEPEPEPLPAPSPVVAPLPAPAPLLPPIVVEPDGPRPGPRIAAGVVVTLIGGAVFAGSFLPASWAEGRPNDRVLPWVVDGMRIGAGVIGATGIVLVIRGAATPPPDR